MDRFTPRKNVESFELKHSVSKMICSSCAQEFAVSDGVTRCPYDNALLAPVLEDPFIGQILADKYEIVGLLGVGGFAHVYKAVHMALERDVAVKILGLHLVSHLEAVKRFEHEAKIVSQLTHPNIVAVHDYGLVPQPYLVMEYLEGDTLENLIGGNPVPFDLTVNIFSQVCDAMQAAHNLGAIHRDLKPSNVMLIKDQNDKLTAKILDFGVAKLTSDAMMSMSGLTRSGETMGSPPYMSPEQCQGRQPDRRSDIYSLGCMLYETLSGEQPFTGRNSVELMHKHMMEAVPEILHKHPGLKIPKAMEYIISTAMAKDPEDRYQSMTELKADLKAAAELSVKDFRQHIQKKRRRRKGNLLKPALISAGTTILLIGAGTAIWYIQSNTSTTQGFQQKSNENDPKLLSKLKTANQAIKEGAYSRAKGIMNDAIALFPNSPSAYRTLAYAQLKEALIVKSSFQGVRKAGPFQSAIESATTSINLGEKHPQAYEIRILALSELNQPDTLTEAEKDCQELTKLAPGRPMTLILRALLLSKQGDKKRALGNLELAAKLDPDDEAKSLAKKIRESIAGRQ